MSLPKKHTIFWLPDAANDYALCPPGSIVTVPHDPGLNDPLNALNGAYLAAKGLRIIVMLPFTSAELSDPALYASRLTVLANLLSTRGITPWAISIGDEAFDYVNSPAALSWPCYAGMTRVHEDMLARKQFLFSRLTQLFALTKQRFPAVPLMQVETLYCASDVNPGLWHPACPDADILAVDPYLFAQGCPWLGTEPLTPTTPASPKFGMEVGWHVAGTPAGHPLNISGAYVYNKPVVLVGQVFYHPDGAWTLPTPTQSRWYFEWGVNETRIIGLGWYSIVTVPNFSVGLDQLPDHYAMVLDTVTQMSGGIPVPDPIALPIGGFVPEDPPQGDQIIVSGNGSWSVVRHSDGSLSVEMR